MMEEFSVLLEEHRAMHTCAGALIHVAMQSGHLADYGPLLHPLAWMTSKVHAPKESLCLLGRLPPDAATTAAVLQLLEDRTRVEQRITQFSERWDRCVFHERVEELALVEALHALTRLMEEEERQLFGVIYERCSNDDLWQIGVDLDRSVDRHGRTERDQFISRHAGNAQSARHAGALDHAW